MSAGGNDRVTLEHRRRLARERDFFERLLRDTGELSAAERTPLAPRRRDMRSARLLAAAALDHAGRERVLDVGSGTGAYMEPFARQTGAQVIAIDLSPALLRHARARGLPNVHVAAADASTLPFPDATFDAVVGNAVLHHLPLEPAVREFARVLKPGGRLCFAEPNLVNPHMWLVLNLPWLRRRAGATPDETAFVRWRLHRTLERHGLGAVSVRPFDFLYPFTPRPLVPLVAAMARRLEALPLVREIAGSLLVSARKAGG
jgi:SAM-dependent methyltransferase